MNTKQAQITDQQLGTPAPGPHATTIDFPSLSPSVSRNSNQFQDISSDSTPESTQTTDHQPNSRKPAPGIFAQKISSEQRSTLFEWLADHTYDEVIELVAAEPPEGFGIKVGKSTLCRFHKANFYEIDKLRQQRLELRAAESLPRDGDAYRAVIRDAYTQLLLERLWELLSRPVQSADELKKLTVIAEKMKSLDRDKEFHEEMKSERSQADIRNIMAALRSRPNPAEGP